MRHIDAKIARSNPEVKDVGPGVIDRLMYDPWGSTVAKTRAVDYLVRYHRRHMVILAHSQYGLYEMQGLPGA
jgi:hypothetical protein